MAELGRDEGELRALGAFWTAREIAQQPAMLRKTQQALVAGQDYWFDVTSRDPDLSDVVTLTGFALRPDGEATGDRPAPLGE